VTRSLSVPEILEVAAKSTCPLSVRERERERERERVERERERERATEGE
jgi:hypothetical protein